MVEVILKLLINNIHMKKLKVHPLKESINTEVEIPGSKSYTNRALILAAMTEGVVVVEKPLFSDDTEAMIGCLETLGIEIEKFDDKVIVKGHVSDVKEDDYELDANLSGTTIRFILALLCVVPGTKILKGKESLNKRPIGDLVDGLRQLGAEIEYIGEDGKPPLKISSSKLKSGITKLNGGVSSQYFTAMMLIAPLVGEVEIEVVGEQISKPYIDLTIDNMKQFGVNVENNNYEKYIIKSDQKYRQDKYLVEGDYSAAGYFAGIAALTKSTIKLNSLNRDTAQGDLNFIKILESMGNKVEYGEDYILIEGMGVKSVDVDMEPCPDQAQTLAVVTAFAEGKTHMVGVRSLRVKETERVQATVDELEKMGIKTEDTDDTLSIYGGNPNTAEIDTYHDHRMAMSFAQAGAVLEEGIIINDPMVVTKTVPRFWDMLREMGIEVEEID